MKENIPTEWENNLWKRLQEELAITESDANDCIAILKDEIREIFKEMIDLYYDPTEAELIANIIFESRNIDKLF
jgi:hypothetical protein